MRRKNIRTATILSLLLGWSGSGSAADVIVDEGIGGTEGRVYGSSIITWQAPYTTIVNGGHRAVFQNNITINAPSWYGLVVQPGHKVLFGDHLTINVTSSADNSDGIHNYANSADWNGNPSNFTFGDNLTVNVQAPKSDGINLDGQAVAHIGDGAKVNVTGAVASHGLRANMNSQIILGDDATISASGLGSYGLYLSQLNQTGVSINVPKTTGSAIIMGKNATIKTSGTFSTGINTAGVVVLDGGAQISTTGTSAIGISTFKYTTFTDGTEEYGSVTINSGGDRQNQIITTGGSSAGIATVKGGTITGDEVLINTQGSGSAGVLLDGGLVTLNNSQVVSDKQYGFSGAGAGALNLNHTSVTGAMGAARYTGTTQADINMNNQSALLGDILVSGSGALNIMATDSSALLGDALISGSGTLNITTTDSSTLLGDVLVSGSGVSNIMAADSTWTGASFGNVGNVNIGLTNSRWNLTGNSSVNSVALQGGSVNFRTDPTYKNLTVNNLNGQGTFFMGANLSEDASLVPNDSLVVGSGSGNFILDVVHTGSNTPLLTGEYQIAQVQNTSGAIQLSLAHLVNAGIYEYGMKNVNDGTNTNYLLYYNGYSPVARTVPNASRSAYLLNYVETNNLIQRMGDLRDNGDRGNVWARAFGGTFDADGAGDFDGFSQDYFGLQVGMDKKLKAGKGDFYLGGLFGYTNANADYAKDGDGEIESYYGGIYGTYHRPDNGFYVDSVFKIGTQKNDMSIIYNGRKLSDKDSSSVWSVSLETGKRFFFNKDKVRQGFYLEPQVELTYGQVGAGHYTFAGITTEIDSVDSMQGRIGMLAGYEVKGGKNPINVYGKLSWVKEFGGDISSRAGGFELDDVSMGDSWWVYGIGITANLNKKHNLYFDIEQASGGSFEQDWKINGGYRFQW